MFPDFAKLSDVGDKIAAFITRAEQKIDAIFAKVETVHTAVGGYEARFTALEQAIGATADTLTAVSQQTAAAHDAVIAKIETIPAPVAASGEPLAFLRAMADMQLKAGSAPAAPELAPYEAPAIIEERALAPEEVPPSDPVAA